MQARQDNPVADDLLEANKVLRFLKMNRDIRLHSEDIGTVAFGRIGVCTDASWARGPTVRSKVAHD